LNETEAAGSVTQRSAVLDLADIRFTDSPRVGPKVARLGQLAAAGWRVPDGYAVTADALGRWLPKAAASELERLLAVPADAPETLHRLSVQARGLIEGYPLPPWLEEAVAEAHERLRLRTGLGQRLRVAVRSSATGEDGARASYAGQYSTYLGVKDVAGVLTHIRECWASGFTAHALHYRRRAGDDRLHEHDLAVGILELVDVRSAGVVFTLDPVTGDRERMVVEANWGFGESVVSGQVTPDQWVVDKASGRVLARTVGVKHVWSALDQVSDTVVLAPLPDDLAARPCLDDDEVRYLCGKAAEIERLEGVPQDVEWAIARDVPLPGSVFILQHRPETAWAQPPEAPGAAEAPAKAFDPVKYALRNVFRVPGT
jgi:pyruvate, water dikinase